MEENKKCPACAEQIKSGAKKCRYCWENFEAKKIEKKKSKNNIIIVTICLVILVFLVSQYDYEGSDTITQQSITQQCNDFYNAPNICKNISPHNGSYPPINDFIQSNLKNPSSFEHITTDISDKWNKLKFRVYYYWENSFWAKTKEVQYLYVDKETLKIEIIK